MQKFGLEYKRQERLSAIELEVFQEKASSLGRAGRKLQVSLEKYYQENSQCSMEKERLINEIAGNLWELVLQREYSGFMHGNLDWIKKHYEIPTEVYSKLGSM